MARTAAVLLAPRIYRIPTVGDFVNSFAFLEADGSVTLVDCGLKWAPKTIVRGLAAIGRSTADVNRIVLTHAHLDHAGGAAAMVERTNASGVDVHVDDVEYVESGNPPAMDPTAPGAALMKRAPWGKFAPVAVANQLSDGDKLDVAGGLTVIHTPGHTPGHISLLHESSGVLITGDAVFNIRRRMGWPSAGVCTSFAQNKESAQILGDLDFDLAAFTHGPEIRDDAKGAVKQFLSTNR